MKYKSHVEQLHINLQNHLFYIYSSFSIILNNIKDEGNFYLRLYKQEFNLITVTSLNKISFY